MEKEIGGDMVRIIFVAIVALAAIGSTRNVQGQEMNVGQLLARYDSVDTETKRAFKEHVFSVGLGILLTNGNLIVQNRRPIFCQPETVTINGDLLFSIFREEVNTDKKYLGAPFKAVGVILLNGLKRTFPCT